ncbi:hypothetical protein [Escherichia phage dw-ec]|nr:hypothetical protein [Escherichia phage dw-ec]
MLIFPPFIVVSRVYTNIKFLSIKKGAISSLIIRFQ